MNYVRSICHSLCKRIPRIVRIVFAGISSNCATRSNKFRFSPKRFHPNSSFRAQKFFSLPRIEFSSFSTKFRSNESRKIRSRFLSCVVRIVLLSKASRAKQPQISAASRRLRKNSWWSCISGIVDADVLREE